MQTNAEWLTIAEAMALTGYADRTIRDWIAGERVVSRLEKREKRLVRLLRRDTLLAAADGSTAADGGVLPSTVVDGDGGPPAAADGAATDLVLWRHRCELLVERENEELRERLAEAATRERRLMGALMRQQAMTQRAQEQVHQLQGENAALLVEVARRVRVPWRR